MAFSASAVAFELVDDGCDDYGRSSFLAFLTHDDRNGFYRVAHRSPGGKWSERSYSADGLAKVPFDGSGDWYVTRNAFCCSKSRSAKYCRHVNSLMFDIDFHSSNDPVYSCGLAYEILRAAWEAGRIPVPTMILSTGRGLQLYYCLERTISYRVRGKRVNEIALNYYRDVQARLGDALALLLECLPDAVFDKSVYDVSRVGRVPGTLNSACGRTCRMIFCSNIFHDLRALSVDVDPDDASQPEPPRQRCSTPTSDSALACSRINLIERLQEIRGRECMGHRELMVFCFYNCAVQAYSSRDDAYNAVRSFNERFLEPLDEAEIQGVQKSVDKVGYYKMGQPKLAEKLGLSEDEAESIGFQRSSKAMRREAAKAQTAERRRERDATILGLYKTSGATQKSVADTVGCSVRTVASVLKEAREADARTAVAARSALLESLRDLLDDERSSTCKKMPNAFRVVVGGGRELSESVNRQWPTRPLRTFRMAHGPPQRQAPSTPRAEIDAFKEGSTEKASRLLSDFWGRVSAAFTGIPRTRREIRSSCVREAAAFTIHSASITREGFS